MAYVFFREYVNRVPKKLRSFCVSNIALKASRLSKHYSCAWYFWFLDKVTIFLRDSEMVSFLVHDNLLALHFPKKRWMIEIICSLKRSITIL